MALFSASDLTIVIGERRLVDQLELALEPGEAVALVGPSGSGKTTTLRALAGLIAAEGKLELEDRTPEDWGWPQFRRRMGFVAQRPIVIDGTVADNLALPFSVKSAEGASLDEDHARDLLAATRLDPAVMGQPARTLSEGERQRVGLVRTLLTEPTMLLLDEPTSALDEEAKAAVEQLITERCDAGAGLVLVSHDASQRQRLASRSIQLQNGVSHPAWGRIDASDEGSSEGGDG